MTFRTLSILLVDDSEDDNFFSARAIRKSGVPASVDVCVDGADALDFLKGAAKYAGGFTAQPDIIFLDINMPKLNGWEFLKKFEDFPPERKTSCIVVMVTTSTEVRDRTKASDTERVSAFLPKPLTANDVTSIATKYFGFPGIEES